MAKRDRRQQRKQGGRRKKQEEAGGSRRKQEEAGGSRREQEEAGGSRRRAIPWAARLTRAPQTLCWMVIH
jgi:hypothetical protein